jgi:hypothetical protein
LSIARDCDCGVGVERDPCVIERSGSVNVTDPERVDRVWGAFRNDTGITIAGN